MPRKKYDLPPDRFVEVWEKATSSDQAAKELSMPKSIMHARASDYRSKGIILKMMPRKSKRLDVEGLNKLIDGLRPKPEETGEDGSIAF